LLTTGAGRRAIKAARFPNFIGALEKSFAIGILNEKCHRMASGRRAIYEQFSAND
jgi:hypothetical protein